MNIQTMFRREFSGKCLSYNEKILQPFAAAICSNQHCETKEFWLQQPPSGFHNCKYDIRDHVRIHSFSKKGWSVGEINSRWCQNLNGEQQKILKNKENFVIF